MNPNAASAHELEIAKQVQARLFPQTFPTLKTLDYAGVCIQARQVGGDYYDFLHLGEDRIALVLGDISGKGIAGALLMANLQANLRSQRIIALDDPQRLLRSVNQLFYDNTGDSSYATLFFAEYDDRAQRVRYVNCGHLCGLLLRGNDTVEQLESTCTVLGLFKEWDCSIGECHLRRGDAIALYTDGVTESFNSTGEEFGEQRLTEALRRHCELSAQDLLAAIVDEVRQFSPGEQYDDITLIVAKCCSPSRKAGLNPRTAGQVWLLDRTDDPAARIHSQNQLRTTTSVTCLRVPKRAQFTLSLPPHLPRKQASMTSILCIGVVIALAGFVIVLKTGACQPKEGSKVGESGKYHKQLLALSSARASSRQARRPDRGRRVRFQGRGQRRFLASPRGASPGPPLPTGTMLT